MQITRVGQAILPQEARGCVQQAIGGANPRRQVCIKPVELCVLPGMARDRCITRYNPQFVLKEYAIVELAVP